MVRALHERGHQVTFYEPDAFERQQHRDMDDPEWARVVVWPARDGSDATRAESRAPAELPSRQLPRGTAA